MDHVLWTSAGFKFGWSEYKGDRADHRNGPLMFSNQSLPILEKLKFWAVVVAQLVEWSLPTSGIHSSNPVKGQIYLLSPEVKSKKKWPETAQF